MTVWQTGQKGTSEGDDPAYAGENRCCLVCSMMTSTAVTCHQLNTWTRHSMHTRANSMYCICSSRRHTNRECIHRHKQQ